MLVQTERKINPEKRFRIQDNGIALEETSFVNDEDFVHNLWIIG